MFPEFTRSQIDELIRSKNHSLHISRHRAQIISERVRGVSTLFAILTPLWIIVDALVFPWPIWGHLALMRLLSSAGFLGLSQIRNERRSLATGYLMLGCMLAIPPMFFLFTQPLLALLTGDTLMRISIKLYSLLPFIVMAGLSVFPLTLAEVLVAAASVLAIVGSSTAYHPLQTVDDMVLTLWMLLLVTGVSGLSGMSQLRYIISLVNQASMDMLTGAFTRRSGRETIDLQFRLSARTDTALTVIFIDVDNFKAVNDEYGHEAGDHLLFQVAKNLGECLRKSDVLVRWGGEEFLILLCDNVGEGASHILQRIAHLGLGLRPDGTPITVSIGIAERKADQCADWDQLIELADNRMYQSKTGGKNRSTGYTTETTMAGIIQYA
jgi:diguanylate cyclase (GGDEF)-like protein